MPRDPEKWLLAERLGVSLPVETGAELALALKADIAELRAYTDRLESSRSAAKNRRAREEIRRELG